jgi:hypothetical protein
MAIKRWPGETVVNSITPAGSRVPVAEIVEATEVGASLMTYLATWVEAKRTWYVCEPKRLVDAPAELPNVKLWVEKFLLEC